MDWKRQAEDMAWFVASADGEDVAVGLAYVGWHSEPGTGTGEALVLPDRRGTGVGSALFRHIAGWVADRGCVVLETSVREDDDGEPRLGRPPWLPRGGPQLAARARPDRRRGAGDRSPRGRRDRDVGRAARPGRAPSTRSPPRRTRTSPEARAAPIDPFDVWLSKDMQGHSDMPEATFVAILDGQVVGYAKLVRSSSRAGVALHDMTGVKRAFRGRGIAGALKRAEIAWAKQQGYEKLETSNEARNEPIRRLNERYGYVVTPGEVVLREALRGRTDAVWRRRAGEAEASTPGRYRRAFSARSICRCASRSAIERRLSPLSLPRPSATSTLTRPFLK